MAGRQGRAVAEARRGTTDGPRWQRGGHACREDRDVGAAAVEDAPLIVFIAAVVISVATALGLTVEGSFVLPCAAWSACP